MPTATLDLTGIASYELFLRGTLDKIGAYPDALHIGEYKTASNQLTERTFTPAHREMAESLNRDLYEQLLKGIASGRQKPEAEVRKLIDHGPFLPEDAVRAGLVDDVAYEDELDDKVSLGRGRTTPCRPVHPRTPHRPRDRRERRLPAGRDHDRSACALPLPASAGRTRSPSAAARRGRGSATPPSRGAPA